MATSRVCRDRAIMSARMPTYRTCFKCKRQMEPQAFRTCPECRAADPAWTRKADYLRDYSRRRRSDPEFKAKETARLRQRHLQTPEDERRRYAREVMQKWRDVPENAAKIAARNRTLGEEVLAHYGGKCE